jgi:phosphate transport system protein
MRTSFENEISSLKNDLSLLGKMVEKQIIGAVDSLKRRDLNSSKEIVRSDLQVNEKRFSIEEKVLIIIATQQPMAHDLRLLASILEIAGELERIGDYAKGIATINIRMADDELLTPLVRIPMMAEKAAGMLHHAVDAFIREDAKAAREIPKQDDEVDELYTLIYKEMMTFIHKDEHNAERANWILWTAHNLERAADRVTNICERTIFTVTGVLKEIESSDI